MRGFLFDENMPRVPFLQTCLPVVHALDLGSRPTDSQLWTHALQNDLAIVTKDADFSQRIVLVAPPPRVIPCAWETCAGAISLRGWYVFGPGLMPRLPRTSS